MLGKLEALSVPVPCRRGPGPSPGPQVATRPDSRVLVVCGPLSLSLPLPLPLPLPLAHARVHACRNRQCEDARRRTECSQAPLITRAVEAEGKESSSHKVTCMCCVCACVCGACARAWVLFIPHDIEQCPPAPPPPSLPGHEHIGAFIRLRGVGLGRPVEAR